MLEPKNTSVGLAGQKAWHICAGEAERRISGKYLPSQLRTQKAGPEPETTGRAGGDGCGSFLKTLAKNGSLMLLLLAATRKDNSIPNSLLHPTERTSLAARGARCKVLIHRDRG